MNDGGAVVKFFDGVAIAQEPLLARAHPIHRDVHSLRAKQEPPMLMFADTLADGIARQFPAKIKRTAANSQPH